MNRSCFAVAGYRVARVLLVSLLLTGAGHGPFTPGDHLPPVAAANGSAAEQAELVENDVIQALADARVTLAVTPLPADRFLIVLSGRLDDEKQIRDVVAKVGRLPGAASYLIRSTGLTVKEPEDLRLKRAREIKLYVERVLDDPRVNVRVVPVANNKYDIILSGSLDNKAEVNKHVSTVKSLSTGMRPALTDVDQVRHQQLVVTPRDVTDVWPLGSLARAGSADENSLNPVDVLVAALNAAYGTEERPIVAMRDRNNLWLTGPERAIHEIKGNLAMVDSPFPQVRLEMWAVQVSGSRARITDQMRAMSSDIRATTERMGLIHPYLQRLIEADHKAFGTDVLFKDLKKIGFEPVATDPHTLNEALIFLGMSNNRVSLVDKLRDRLKEYRKKEIERLDKASKAEKDTKKKAQIDRELAVFKEEDAIPAFRRLGVALHSDSLPTDRQGITNLLDAVLRYQAYMLSLRANESITGRDQQLAPERLMQRSAVVDHQLQALVDAFSADMQEMFLEPLLRRLQNASGARSNGVNLIGKTRVVVNSRHRGFVRPEMFSYVETTRPKPFGKDLLDFAFPKTASETTVTEDTEEEFDKEGKITKRKVAKKGVPVGTPPGPLQGIGGAAGFLATLTPEQAALMAAALTSEVEPTFAEVAPGIHVEVRPSVSADGSTADLILDSSFGVTTRALGNKDRSDVWAQSPPDAIEAHHVQTNAVVTGYDLFDISSFTMQSTAPQAPYYIPILGRLPIIGPAFQIPRKNKKTEHESIILVNATILPRALGLLGFYGGAKGAGAGDVEKSYTSTGMINIPKLESQRAR